MKKTKRFNLILCSLFAALSAILSQIIIPIGAVPINLTHISIFLAAGLLGAKYGAISQAIFVLLGAFGVPVFAGLSGGIGVILGPRGGFIIGYIACAFLSGFIIERLKKSIKMLALAMILSHIITTYFLGTLWYMYITNTTLGAALLVCVIPFLVGDFIKIVISSMLTIRLTPFLNISNSSKISEENSSL